MALTDIARQLKKTFDNFEAQIFPEQIEEFRKKYKDVETVCIDGTNYIVINDEYKSERPNGFPNDTSPLFCNMTKPGYAVIDAKTSSTLIDEVYSRVTYMRRVCKTEGTADEADVEKSLSTLLGSELGTVQTDIIEDGEGVTGSANIFQCQLIKDTGVSASSDTYSFMLKSGEVKELDAEVMKQIRKSGEVSLLKDNNEVRENNDAIQRAVFAKYNAEDIDIQSISVRSIFELALSFCSVNVQVADKKDLKEASKPSTDAKIGLYRSTYLPSDGHEFDGLNATIHTCNCCSHSLVDVTDGRKHKMHINIDALACDEKGQLLPNKNGRTAYAVGCDECLEKCPECGEWHFNYAKLVKQKGQYAKVIFADGRKFLKGLTSVDGNYCACREAIEWTYDELTGNDDEHGIIPVEKMAFVNYANEQIGTYAEWIAFYKHAKKNKKLRGFEEAQFAKDTLSRFKKRLADGFEIDKNDVKITSSDRCRVCSVCGGSYVPEKVSADYDYRCPVCEELVTEKQHMVTRIDGVIFMRTKKGGRDVVSKYVMTKLGNLRRLSQKETVIDTGDDTADDDGQPTEI